MKFVCDMMLGRLAKWLRLLGYDTLYFEDISDDRLLEIAARDDRLLLTRDRRLCRRRPVNRGEVKCLLVEDDIYLNQIAQVARTLKLDLDRPPRCNLCNASLAPLDAAKVAERVPSYVAATQRRFEECPVCGRVYWSATHWERIGAVKQHLRRLIYGTQ